MEFLGIGLPELLVILVLALIVVGPNKLPEMAAHLARFVRAARRYGNQVTQDFNEALHDLEEEYDEMKGEWKEVGQGLDSTAKEVGGHLKAVDSDVQRAVNTAAKESPTSKPEASKN